MVNVISARGLANKDDGSGDVSDPYVIVCFDGLVTQEIGRTQAVQDNLSPVWEETIQVDMTTAMSAHMEAGGAKPKSLSFCIFDKDDNYDEPLGVASIPLRTLLTAGFVDGEYSINNGKGSMRVAVAVKKAKVSSMLKGTGRFGAGAAAGTGALGLFTAYLNEKNKRRRRRERNRYGYGGSTWHGGRWNGGGVGYGHYDSESSSSDGENLVSWWEMDDASSSDSDVFSFSNDGWSSSDDSDGDYDDGGVDDE